MPKSEVEDLVQYMTDMKFLPGGRYIYYAGRDPETRYYNNCFLLKRMKRTRERTGQNSLRRPPAPSCPAVVSAWTTASIARLEAT